MATIRYLFCEQGRTGWPIPVPPGFTIEIEKGGALNSGSSPLGERSPMETLGFIASTDFLQC